jgi:hypothetical protein
MATEPRRGAAMEASRAENGGCIGWPIFITTPPPSPRVCHHLGRINSPCPPEPEQVDKYVPNRHHDGCMVDSALERRHQHHANV